MLILFLCHPSHKSVVVRNTYNIYIYALHVKCMYIYIYKYVCILAYNYIYIYICLCIYVHVCIYIFIYMCVYMCVYVCIYIFMYICLYIFFTYVYLYLIVYNWCKNGHFNISLIYFELGKHVCIFLHSFILWQIDTYLLILILVFIVLKHCIICIFLVHSDSVQKMLTALFKLV